MAKNLIPEITKIFGVEIGEVFGIKGFGHYRFTETRLECVYCSGDGFLSGLPLNTLLNAEIIKLPFEPKKGDDYWTYDSHSQVIKTIWCGDFFDCRNEKLGFVFRTEEEALKVRPQKFKELTGKEWEE